MKLMLVILLSGASIATCAAQGPSGPVRNEFVENFYKTCFQMEDAQKKGYDLADLGRYLADRLADRLSQEEYAAIEALGPSAASSKMRPVMTDVSRACLK